MKKYLSILTIVSLLCFGYKSNAQLYSYTLTNFTSTCVKPTLPRQFTLTFKVTFSGGTATSVLFTTTNGNFNAMPNGVSWPLVGNTANVTLTYSEVMPQTTVPIQMIFSNGTNNLLRPLSSQTLCSCGSLVNCSSAFVTPTVQGGFGNSANSSLLIMIYPKAGPDSVKSVNATINSVKRRSICTVGGTVTTGSWVTTSLTLLATAPSTQNFIPARNYNQQGSDFPTYYNPPAKLNPTCKEEYQVTVTTTVTFKNGCTASSTNTITVIRP